ncbi:MAG TPA: DegV family protein [Verrucomicrobiae bacterium]|nr:DegV family protein [Verrucomicrobiae bacterium]
MAVAIVTDSTSDIEPARAAELGIAVVPLFVVFGDRSFKDYVELSRAEFYRKLETDPVLPTTSQPTAAMFEEAFLPAVQAGDEVLCIVISSHLSGTINAAQAAAGAVRERFPGAAITVYDSQTAAAGLGMLAIRASELAAHGEDAAAIVAELDRIRATQRLYACFSDLSHLQRTGRIGKAQAMIGSLMKIVPVLSLKDGAVCAEAQVRTFARATQAMLDLVLQAAGDGPAHFVVVHTNAPPLAQAVAGKLRERIGEDGSRSIEMSEAGPVIATHGGEGAVGVFVARE